MIWGRYNRITDFAKANSLKNLMTIEYVATRFCAIAYRFTNENCSFRLKIYAPTSPSIYLATTLWIISAAVSLSRCSMWAPNTGSGHRRSCAKVCSASSFHRTSFTKLIAGRLQTLRLVGGRAHRAMEWITCCWINGVAFWLGRVPSLKWYL